MKSYFEYLPGVAPSMADGLTVRAGGYTRTPPKAPYPIAAHPSPYQFTWEQGRTLESYQLIFIRKGQGLFESQPTGVRTIHPGTAIILFPGIWHRYKPDSASGWDEHWLEIRGSLLEKWRSDLPDFTPEKAIVPLPESDEILNLFRIFHRMLQRKNQGYRIHIAGIAAALFALARGNPMQPAISDSMEEAIRNAQQQLTKYPGRHFQLTGFLQEFSLSEAHFRKHFKLSTGLTIKDYQHSIRLAHAQSLLLNSHQTIKEIAGGLGFHSQFHFSAFFSKQAGVCPTQFRHQKDSF